ncbi:MAG: LysM peptidoglycan-binding domain-containing protein [Bacteroidota bacterium]
MRILSFTFFSIFFISTAWSQPADFQKQLDGSYFYWDNAYTLIAYGADPCLQVDFEKYAGTEFDSDSIKGFFRQNCEKLAYLYALSLWIESRLPASERGFFAEYKYMAMLLSGLNPVQEGRYNRVGIWQLSYPVAVRYGLRVDERIDERKDVILSTIAAKAYFSDLKNKLGEESAKLAFYQSPITSKNANSSAKKQTGQKLALSWHHTQRIFQVLDEQNLDDVTLKPVYPLEEIYFTEDVALSVLLKETDINGAIFSRYNPSFVGTDIPANYSALPIYLPSRIASSLNSDQLIQLSLSLATQEVVKLDSIRKKLKKGIPAPGTHDLLTYVIRPGDNLGAIARRYGVNIKDLRRWNGLRGNVIYAGKRLVVYKAKGSKIPDPVVVEAPNPKPKEKKPNAVLIPGQYVTYEVKQGDTLWKISKQYDDVSPEDIMKWNDIDERIDIGQKLKIRTKR